MGRFLGTVNTRLGLIDAGFTKAAVITTPGTSTFTVPSSATKAKVFVVGAGSNYRPGRYCATSTGCWSGVEQPVCNYSFDFCGHLMGAGGGYAEKLYGGAAAGVTLSIAIGSPTFTSTAYFTNASNSVTGISGLYRDALAVGATLTASAVTGSPTISTITKTDAIITGTAAAGATTIPVNTTTNVFPGNLIVGPGLTAGTLITSISAGVSVTISTVLQENIVNGVYTVSGANITISSNATSTTSTTATITGLSSSSVSGTGLATVSATNATDSTFSFNANSVSSARDISLDNITTTGIRLPACGYCQYYDGFRNLPGTGSGGDINRTGGAGVLIPEFLGSYNCIDAVGASAGGGGVSGGWTGTYITCAAIITYHTTFGVTQCCSSVFPNCYPCNCICPFVCNNLTNTPAGSPATAVNFKYLGNATRFSMNPTTYDTMQTPRDVDQSVPIGMGASSGSSSGDGRQASSPDSTINSNWTVCGNATSTPTAPTPGAGGSAAYTASSASTVNYYYTQSGYDFSFGGVQYSCICHSQVMGCVFNSGVCGALAACSFCYRCGGHGFTNVFGSIASSPPCMCFLYQAGGGGGGSDINKCIAYSYKLEPIKSAESGAVQVLRTSHLLDQNGNSLSDVAFSKGAGSTPASYGGGGNRLFPAGGTGAVVILWG